MDDTGNRLALWGVLVIAGMFVMALLAIGNVAGWLLAQRPRVAL